MSTLECYIRKRTTATESVLSNFCYRVWNDEIINTWTSCKTLIFYFFYTSEINRFYTYNVCIYY